VSQILINTKEDMKWLRDTKLPGLDKKFKSAVIFGNEDYPDKIDVYVKKDPLVTDTPVTFLPHGEEGWGRAAVRQNPRRTYTWGTTPKSVIRKALPPMYKMDLNEADYSLLEDALLALGPKDAERLVDAISTRAEFYPDEMMLILESLGASDDENAMSLRSGILQTIGIEEV
jgi:hypothetical protein